MNKEEEKSIKSNLTTLANKTENVEKLMEILRQKRLISDEEIERIKTFPTKPQRCSDLYLLMLRKGGPEVFDVLYEALLASGNEQVADILKPTETPGRGQNQKQHAQSTATNQKIRTKVPSSFRRISKQHSAEWTIPSSSSNSSPKSTSPLQQSQKSPTEIKPVFKRSPSRVDVDVQIKETHVKGIVDILDTFISHAEWPVIVNDLLDPSVRGELDKLPSTASYEVIFEKTLQLWIQSQGSNAKLNFLLSVLDSRRQEETADALVKRHKKIFGETS